MPGPESYDLGKDIRTRKATTREQVLAWIAAIFFSIAILFLVLFVIYYVKNEDEKTTEDPVCTTANCVTTAMVYIQTMNPEVDPCENFAEYTCGKFYKEAIIQDDRQYTMVFLDIIDENKKMFRRLLEEDVKADDREFVKKMKGFFGECIDEAQIEKVGLADYFSDHAPDWPTLNPAWDKASFNLNNLVEKYERIFTHGIFAYQTKPNYTDSSQNIFMLTQPYLGLALSQMLMPRNDTTIMAYQQFYEDYSVALGADPATASKDAKDVIDFEIELAKIFVTRTEEADVRILSNPIRLRDMAVKYPFIDWHRLVQAIYSSMNVTIGPDYLVNIKHLKYFDGLADVLDKFGDRVIQNRVLFENAYLYLPTITRSLREARFKFFKVIRGVKHEDSRSNQCVDMVNGFYSMGLSKLFVSRTFSESSKTYMTKMIGHLKSSFKEVLQEADWLEEETKTRAYWKLGNMTDKIGYPDKKFSNNDLDLQYENFTVVKGNFYTTYIESKKQDTRQQLKTLFEPYDHSKWETSPNDVNAFYYPSANSINFPAGILQPIIFSDKYPSSINFGGIGAIIGHEITHGFDKSGSRYDETGTVFDWWQKGDRQEYEDRTKCLVDQYSSYRVDQVGMNVNGNRTLMENMADNGGIKIAFRAYKKFAATQEKESPLPGLGLTPEQQFFLASSRYHCFKMTDAAMRIQVMARPHSPSRYRIIGNVQNSEDFARVYKCPKGSPMNPVNKCKVW